MLGSLSVMLLFIIIILILNKTNRILMLYLAVADIIAICYALSTGEFIIQYIFPGIPFRIYFTMYYLLSISGGTILIFLINNLYKEIGTKFVQWLSLCKTIVFVALLIFASEHFVGIISNTKDILVLVEFVYCIVIMIIALRMKRKKHPNGFGRCYYIAVFCTMGYDVCIFDYFHFI